METEERVVEAWLETHQSPNTRAAYAGDIAAFLGWCRAGHLHPFGASVEDVDRYRQDCLEGGASPATVARRLSGLASFFRFAHDAGAVRANPADGVDRPEPADTPEGAVLDATELDSLLQSAQAIGPKAGALLSLLTLDGLKLGEALAIDVPHVSLGRPSSVEIRRHGQPARLPVVSQSARAVAEYVGSRRRGPLFLGERPAGKSSRLTRFGADFLIKRAGAAAGIAKPVSANVLRRTYAEAAHRAGQPLDSIARQLGHIDRRDTARLLEPRR
jgi:integrase/recombinase XerD